MPSNVDLFNFHEDHILADLTAEELVKELENTEKMLLAVGEYQRQVIAKLQVWDLRFDKGPNEENRNS